MAGSSTLRSSTASAGSSLRRSARRSGLGRRSPFSSRDLASNAARRSSANGFSVRSTIRSDELLRREEAAAVLARVAVGTDRYLAVVVAGGFLFQQALVDRPKLLDGHVTVVDESPPLIRLGVAEVVDDGRNGRVRQADTLQQRRGITREQAAVVGRKPDGLVATVDNHAQRRQVVVVAGGDGGEGVLIPCPLGNVVAYPLSKPVVVVPRVVDRQESPVLGIEHEEQPVQEDQGGMAYVGEAFAGCVRKGLNQLGKDLLENHARKVLRNLLLVAAPLRESGVQERGDRAVPQDERVAPE